MLSKVECGLRVVKGRMLEFLPQRELLDSGNSANKGCHPQRVVEVLELLCTACIWRTTTAELSSSRWQAGQDQTVLSSDHKGYSPRC